MKLNTMKYITILDFEVGKIFQYEVGKDWNPYSESIENFLSGVGHRLKDCEWMVHSDPRIITK